jgi:ribosome-binding factor A
VARARVADAAVAAAREGAEPAGDPDPYRVRADPDSGDEPDAGSRPGSADRGAESGGSPGPLGDYPAAGDGRARYSRRE